MIQKKKKKKKKRRRRRRRRKKMRGRRMRKKMNLLVTLKYVMRRRKKVTTVRGCLLTSFGHVTQSEQVTCGGWSEGRCHTPPQPFPLEPCHTCTHADVRS